jgi:hypothetical protein
MEYFGKDIARRSGQTKAQNSVAVNSAQFIIPFSPKLLVTVRRRNAWVVTPSQRYPVRFAESHSILRSMCMPTKKAKLFMRIATLTECL